MKRIGFQWKALIVLALLILVGYVAGVLRDYTRLHDSTRRLGQEHGSSREEKEKEVDSSGPELLIRSDESMENVKDRLNLDIIRVEYEEAVNWIRTMWGLRFTLISILLTAFGIILTRIRKPVVIFLLLPLVFFVDFGCTYDTLPFIYSSIYIEKYYFSNTHHIISNWNRWQSIPIDELVRRDDSEMSHRKFKKEYLVGIYKKKLTIYFAFIIIICLSYVFLRDKKLATDSSSSRSEAPCSSHH